MSLARMAGFEKRSAPLIQHFHSVLNLHNYFHKRFIDGVHAEDKNHAIRFGNFPIMYTPPNNKLKVCALSRKVSN